MLKMVLALVLIYISPISQAAGLEGDSFSASAAREMASIGELLPDMEDLERQPRCEGNARSANSCAQFATLDNCLEAGADHGCFWAYY